MHQYKDIYTIDFSNIQSYLEMHFAIKEALDFPDYYGCNWDAFWDCLTNMIGRTIHIEIKGFDVIERKFDDAAKIMLEILKELKHYDNNEYINDIQIEIFYGNKRTEIK